MHCKAPIFFKSSCIFVFLIFQVTTSCQNTIQYCGLLDKFCSILMAVGIPADILTETINTLGECIRGCDKNQEVFSRYGWLHQLIKIK
jgi:hypothetical protein